MVPEDLIRGYPACDGNTLVLKEDSNDSSLGTQENNRLSECLLPSDWRVGPNLPLGDLNGPYSPSSHLGSLAGLWSSMWNAPFSPNTQLALRTKMADGGMRPMEQNKVNKGSGVFLSCQVTR